MSHHDPPGFAELAANATAFMLGFGTAVPFCGVLLGVTLLQAYQYSKSIRRKTHQLEVWRVCIVVIVSTAFFMAIAVVNVRHVINGRLKPTTPLSMDPVNIMVPVMIGIVQVTVQTFFLNSLYGMTKSKILATVIGIWIFIGFLGSLGGTITLAVSPSALRENGFSLTDPRLSKASLTMLFSCSADIIVDVSLAIGLTYKMKASNFGFSPTENLLTKLAVGFVATFSSTALLVVATVAVYYMPKVGSIAGKPSGIGTFIFLLLLRIPVYSNSFLFTLNRRDAINQQLRSDHLNLGSAGWRPAQTKSANFDLSGRKSMS